MKVQGKSVSDYFKGLSDRDHKPTPQDMWREAFDDTNSEGAKARKKNNAWNEPYNEESSASSNANKRDQKVWFTKVSHRLFRADIVGAHTTVYQRRDTNTTGSSCAGV